MAAAEQEQTTEQDDDGTPVRMPRGRERRVSRRLEHAGSYREDWRPGGCERKLGEVVADDTGRWWVEVYCKSCSRRRGERTFHLLPVDKGRLQD